MISIIIPVLNEESTIREMLERLGAYEHPPEVILVDGGSTDRTVAIARECGFSQLTTVETISGRAHQMNEGARAATGEILLFLHADTRLPKRALETVESCMKSESVVGGRFEVKLDNPRLLYRVVGAMINIRDGLFGGFTGDQAIFIRTSVFHEMGGFREIELCEDLDIAKRLKNHGTVVRIPLHVTTSARRWEKSGPVRTIALMWIIRVLFYAGVSPSRLAQLYANVR